MGRTLTNTTVNLGIQSACDEAMYQVNGSVKKYLIQIVTHDLFCPILVGIGY